jgi:Recombinase/Resolvase, N terminal domain
MQVTFPDGITINVNDAIVLARKSQKMKGRAETSIESQDEDARDWAEEAGLHVVATVPDVASGKKAMWDRPNAKPWVTQPDLMAKYQAIVAARHNRLSRAGWRDENDIRRWAEDNHIALFLVEKDLRWPPRQGAHYDDDVANWNREAEASNREWNNTSRQYKRSQRKLISNNHLVGRPIYGYRATGVDCGKTPCRCYEQEIEDHKMLTIYEPEAKYVREIVARYLAGESLQALCDDLFVRGIPSPKYGKSSDRWIVSSLARLLRNPGLAGRRMNAKGETVHRYEGIITWNEHEQLVKRLDSRAHRKGISPANVYMQTGVIIDAAGHPMYPIKGGERNKHYYYYCRICLGLMVHLEKADEEVTSQVIDTYGHLPHMVIGIIPGKNHFNDIEQLRQDRDEVQAKMDKADDPTSYLAWYTEISAEIRRLTKLDQEHPEPDKPAWVPTGKTIAEYWQSLGVAGRRDWLKQNGWKVTAIKDDEMPDGWRLFIDAGWTADINREITSLGFPLGDYYQTLAELPERLGIPSAEADAS